MVSVVLTALQGAYYRVSLLATFIPKKGIYSSYFSAFGAHNNSRKKGLKTNKNRLLSNPPGGRKQKQTLSALVSLQ